MKNKKANKTKKQTKQKALEDMDVFFRCSMRKLSQLFIIKKRSDKLKQLGYESL